MVAAVIRRLLAAKRDRWADARGVTSWYTRGGEGHRREEERHERKDHRIARPDAEQQARHDPGQVERTGDTDQNSCGSEPHRLPDDQTSHLTGCGAQCHADADFPGALLRSEEHTSELQSPQ